MKKTSMVARYQNKARKSAPTFEFECSGVIMPRRTKHGSPDAVYVLHMVSKVVPMVCHEPSPRAPNAKIKKVRTVVFLRAYYGPC